MPYGHGRLHFRRAPVFPDAHYLEAKALESGNDGGLSAGKVSGLERPFAGKLMAEGSPNNGLRVAQVFDWHLLVSIAA